MFLQNSNISPSQFRRRVLAGWNGRAGVQTSGASRWQRERPVGAPAPGRRQSRAWVPVQEGETRSCRCRHTPGTEHGVGGAAVVTGGTDAVTETSATASAVHLPAMSLGDVVVVLEDLPASRAFPAAAGGCGRSETASGCVWCLIGWFVALSDSVCEFALSVVLDLELSGAGVYGNDTGLGVLRRGLTGWRALRRLRP